MQFNKTMKPAQPLHGLLRQVWEAIEGSDHDKAVAVSPQALAVQAAAQNTACARCQHAAWAFSDGVLKLSLLGCMLHLPVNDEQRPAFCSAMSADGKEPRHG